jgi:hypothetical protein
MTRGSTIIWGKDELTRAPAPDAKHIRRVINPAWYAVPASLTRSHSLGPRNESASVAKMMATPVGLREGRLSERSPADHHRAAQSREKQAVQGDRLSHSFLTARASFKLAKLAQAMFDVFAALFGLFYVALWIVVILGILPFTVFCLFLIQF